MPEQPPDVPTKEKKRKKSRPGKELTDRSVFLAEYQHTTRADNVPSIRTEGLQPSRAGTGGLTDAVSTPGYDGPLKMQLGDATLFKDESAGFTYLSKGPRIPRSMQRSFEAAGQQPQTLTTYIPYSRVVGPQKDVEPDPQYPGTTQIPHTGQSMPRAFRAKNAIAPEAIMTTTHDLGSGNAILPANAKGPDWAPPAAIEAVKSYLPARFANRTNAQLIEDMRESQHGARKFPSPESSNPSGDEAHSQSVPRPPIAGPSQGTGQHERNAPTPGHTARRPRRSP